MPSYVIAGASRGIGLEFVRQLSVNSANIVVGLVRNKNTATDLVALQNRTKYIHILQADITDRKALKAAAEEVRVLTGGTLDCLINNGAYTTLDRMFYTLDSYPEDEQDLFDQDIENNFRTNTLGPIYVTNAFLSLLRATAATKTSKVISITSLVGDCKAITATEIPQGAAYSISKAGLNMAMAKYGARFKDENIIFLSLSPGLVNTATGTPPPEVLEYAGFLFERFKAGFPDWTPGAISPEESVQMMLKVIGGLQIEDSGKTLSHFGNEKWL